MIYTLNETHDPNLRSWVESANTPDADFPIQNLPFGVFRRCGVDESPCVGVAIGDQIVDITKGLEGGLFDGLAADAAAACNVPRLNDLMALGHESWSALRRQLSSILRQDSPALHQHPRLNEALLVPIGDAEVLLPAQIGDYTDFYASIHHATNVGRMFRPDNPLLPNYKYVPIGYHGRASSIVPSGTAIRRPRGQIKGPQDESPVFKPSELLDYEAEIGVFIGPGNTLGESVAMGNAVHQMFGLCIVNDWSARDIQTWEYQPLGPFLAKSFATTISSWVVTLEALVPYRTAAFARPSDDPEPLPYLADQHNITHGGINLTIEVAVASEQMRGAGMEPLCVSRSRLAEMYWTMGQLVTHHASNGCNLRPGDLLASGTISGPQRDARGCLLELTMRGAEPLTLPTGEARRFLEDGDEVIMRAFCMREGAARIGFGECRGVIVHAAAQ